MALRIKEIGLHRLFSRPGFAPCVAVLGLLSHIVWEKHTCVRQWFNSHEIYDTTFFQKCFSFSIDSTVAYYYTHNFTCLTFLLHYWSTLFESTSLCYGSIYLNNTGNLILTTNPNAKIFIPQVKCSSTEIVTSAKGFANWIWHLHVVPRPLNTTCYLTLADHSHTTLVSVITRTASFRSQPLPAKVAQLL